MQLRHRKERHKIGNQEFQREDSGWDGLDEVESE